MNTSTITTIELLRQKVVRAAEVLAPIPEFKSAFEEYAATAEDAKDYDGYIQGIIWYRLKLLGIYEDAESHELLISNECVEGEARRVFCENGEPNLPVARFKRVWSILKGIADLANYIKGETGTELTPGVMPIPTAVEKAISAIRPIDNWGDEELVNAYGPDCPANIHEELARRSKGRAFVIFKDEDKNIVDTNATLRMLREARKRETPIHYKAEDALKRLFKAGDFPNQVYEECPLHPHVLLLDGYCDECGHTWEGVEIEQRQFVRVAQEMGETPDDGPGIRQLIATARENDDNLLINDYPKVTLKYRDLKTEGKLPSLKSRKATSGKQDPFAAGKRF